jgi:hypothetical protein
MKKALKKGMIQSVRKIDEPPTFILHTCQNCEYTFEGNFCPSCGQSVEEVQKPITHFIGDLFGSVFALDIRLIESLPLLLLKPGKLSAEYIDGKRARHVAPFKLYFFSSLIFFFLIGWQTKTAVREAMKNGTTLTVLDSTRIQLSAVRTSPSGDTLMQLNNLQDGVGLMDKLRKETKKELADSTLTPKEKEAKKQKLDLYQNPEVLVSKLYQYASWSFFILMPLFALILYVFFRKKRKFYVEHLIYSVNLHSFFFIIAIFALLLSILIPVLFNKIGGFIFLFTIIYSIVGIRKFYRTSWVSAIFSSIGLFTLYLICAGGIVVLIALTFLR